MIAQARTVDGSWKFYWGPTGGVEGVLRRTRDHSLEELRVRSPASSGKPFAIPFPSGDDP